MSSPPTRGDVIRYLQGQAMAVLLGCSARCADCTRASRVLSDAAFLLYLLEAQGDAEPPLRELREDIQADAARIVARARDAGWRGGHVH